MAKKLLPLKETVLIRGEELLAMADLEPCELVLGRIVPMTPTGAEHGGCEGNFHLALRIFVEARNLGKVLVGEVGIYTHRDPDTVRAADVIFISSDRYDRCPRKAGFLEVAPELVVEILSPRETWRGLRAKLHEYFESGVLLVWVADPRKRLVRAYHTPSSFSELSAEDTLSGGDVLPGFGVKVAKLFE